MNLTKLAIATLLSGMSFMSLANELPNAPHVETSGVGIVDVQPDMATLTINVSASAKKSVDAKKEVDKRMAEYFAFLDKSGIEKKDISAANVTTSAEYDYAKAGSPTLIGYRANRQVVVTLRQLDKLNPLLDGALESQLNEINSIQLGVSDTEKYQTEARTKAIENATQQAKALAEGFGAKLGSVYRISYQVNNGTPMPVMYRAQGVMKMESNPQADATYAQETIKFNDNVNVVFELQR